MPTALTSHNSTIPPAPAGQQVHAPEVSEASDRAEWDEYLGRSQTRILLQGCEVEVPADGRHAPRPIRLRERHQDPSPLTALLGLSENVSKDL